MMTQPKYYVVLKGRKTGIFSNWQDCKLQVDGFKGAIYKSFKTLTEAEKALCLTQKDFIANFYQQNNRPLVKPTLWGEEIITNSICVDASCLGNPGILEYRGVNLATGEVIFHQKAIANGTNNIGEFLAIVHGLIYLRNCDSSIPIYSDSKIAINWVKRQKVSTTLEPTSENKDVFDLINQALDWLNHNSYQNAILKWDTATFGEIPADFGRK